MKRVMAKITAFVMVLGIFLQFSPMQANAASIRIMEALSDTIGYYYCSENNYELKDWQELAAVYAYCAKGDYSSPVNLSRYDVSQISESGAAKVFADLMLGQKESAENEAQKLVSGGVITRQSYASTQAMNMLAIEAFNRSVDTDERIDYDKNDALDCLFGLQNADGGYGYSWGGTDYDDVDTAAMVLMALSLYTDADNASVSAQKTSLGQWIKQKADVAPEMSNANTISAVIWAGISQNYDFSDWTNSPIETLMSFRVDCGGFGYTDNLSINAYATKQATIALADFLSGKCFFTEVKLNGNCYTKNVKFKIIGSDQTLFTKTLTVTDAYTLDEAVELAIGSNVSSGDYRYFENGTQATALKDGMSVLAVHKDVAGVAYFSKDGSPVGTTYVTVPFGGTATLTLNLFDTESMKTSVLANAPIDIDGDTYFDIATSEQGTFTISPLTARMRLDAIKRDFAGTHIADNIAALPIYINMESAAQAQTKTVSVRVEGLTANVCNYTEITVTNDGSSVLTAYDAVVQALDDAGIPYVANNGYISSIGGVKAAQGGGLDGWLWTFASPEYLNGSKYAGGMNGERIEDGDNIVVYYSYYDPNTYESAKFVDVSSEQKTDGSIVIAVKTYGDYFNTANIPVSGVSVIWDGTLLSDVTDENGQVTIPAENAAKGTHTLQVEKLYTASNNVKLPMIIRLAPNTTITVSDDGSQGGGSSGGVSTEKTVKVSVEGPNGTLFKAAKKTWFKGMTVLDALKSTGLEFSIKGEYIESINGIAEFDYGVNSGWKYKVNGVAVQVSAVNCTLAAGDEVEWYYVVDYTKDDDGMISGNSTSNRGSSSSGKKDDSTKQDTKQDETTKTTEPETPMQDFSDVPQTHKYYDSIRYVQEAKLMNGTGNGNFNPDGKMTRAMFVTVLYRFAGMPATSQNITFSDIKDGEWYADAVAWAAENDIIRGYGDGRFGRDDNISTEHIMLILERYFKKNNYNVNMESMTGISVIPTRAEIAGILADICKQILTQN